ncbi:alpha/beta hydrolase [Actinomadura barringtoniae]|uniref:Alpha/beta hydrolase n=1 Tax=Actinomadura barringtoniae TaxID=1427535 RepID=A0A939T5L3_9ACTN|nr:alpha/beta hydrolase [Actinomadura barringtoniae]MBO2449664.1 alpha/beta hydrolase [Actinomadura barringtoniae]
MPAPPTTLLIDRHGAASLRSRALAAGIRAVLQPRLAKWGEAPFDERALRRAASFDRMAARSRPPKGTRTERVRLDDFRAEWVHGPGVTSERDRVILYLHGGAWVSCGLNTHRRMISWFSAAAGVPAFAVDYRMIPAVPFEEEVEDCLTAYRWLLEEREIAPERIVIMGDSAGGHLTFATALRAREAGLPMPAALVGISPMLDMDLASKLAHANIKLDPAAPGALLERLVDGICGHLDRTDPAVSPIRADLSGLPPVLLSAGSTEVLYCDSELMAHRLAEAGVPTTLQVWDRQVHVFQMFGPLLPESRAAIAEAGTFVRDAFTAAEVRESESA